MKSIRKRNIFLLVLLLVILLIPIPSGTYKDGGTKTYTALTYKIVHWNRLIGADGVYEKVSVYPFPLNFSSIDALWTRENVTYDEPKEDGSNPVLSGPEAYAFEAQYIRTDGYSEERSYPYHVVIDSRKDLEAYYEANKDLFDLERRDVVYSDTSIGFLDACDKYDDAYFERQNLVLIVLQDGSGSVRHEITDVRRHQEDNTLNGWDITIDRIVPEVGTDDMAQWHLFLEVQMGNVIGAADEVWINGKRSDRCAIELTNTGTGSSIQSDKIMAPEQPIIITANDGSVFPYRHFLYSGTWDGNGFLCADGVDLLSKLPQLKADGIIPQIHYSDDFNALLENGVTLQRILLYDEDFKQLDTLLNISDLSMLDAGEYYVGFVVNWQGAYIEAAQQNEYIGWACTLNLIVDDTQGNDVVVG